MRYVLPIAIFPLLAALSCTHAPARRASSPPVASTSRFDAADNPIIVRMVGRNKTLIVSSSSQGPVYSVSNPAGQILLSQGSLDDLRRLYPELYRHVRSALVLAHDGHAAPDSPEEPMDFLLLAR